MKKLLFILLFLPLMSFGQDVDIDYSSEKSIFNYFESNSSEDILEGVWSTEGATLVIKSFSKDKYAVILSGWRGFPSRFNGLKGFYWGKTNNGDTLAIIEKSIGGNKLFVTSNAFKAINSEGKERLDPNLTYQLVANKNNISIYKHTLDSTIDTPSLLIPFFLALPGTEVYPSYSQTIPFRGFLKPGGKYLTLSLFGSNNFPLIKTFPKPSFNLNKNSEKENKTVKTTEWAGNGSGIIISKSGHIVTNYHVIENAEDIEVEFIVNDELQRYNAEIVQVDKINDLAIIKIFDMNFDGVDEPPYNFNTRSSDVGTKVYAYGYPMALSVMGKEIKITDGIISSKSGYDGNVTTYQISAPIQGGNSGGPLFDDKGNFLGINSSGLSADVANNVGYTIKSSYVFNLIDVLPKTIDLPSSTKLQSLPLTEQIKEISKYVVLIKVK